MSYSHRLIEGFGALEMHLLLCRPLAIEKKKKKEEEEAEEGEEKQKKKKEEEEAEEGKEEQNKKKKGTEAGKKGGQILGRECECDQLQRLTK